MRQIPTEVYSRPVGFLRPVSWYNQGKAQEFKERKTYSIDKLNTRTEGATARGSSSGMGTGCGNVRESNGG